MAKAVCSTFSSTWGSLASNNQLPVYAAAPPVPASLAPVQNTTGAPQQVVITGGTMTAVVVNGATVGTGAGTYMVPDRGVITLTYSVAPTWAWSGTLTFTPALNSDGTHAKQTGHSG